LTVHAVGGRRLSLADLRGRYVVLAFTNRPRPELERALPDLPTRLQSLKAAAIVACRECTWCVRPDSDEPVESHARLGEIAARVYGRGPRSAGSAMLVVIDRDGIVRFTHAGGAEPAQLTDAFSEALHVATMRLCAPPDSIRIATRDWMTLAVVAAFIQAFVHHWHRGNEPKPAPPALLAALAREPCAH
jgi:hypothetical protein